MSDNNDDILQQLRDILGEAGIREQPDDNMPDIVLKPGSTEEVSAILKVCHDHGQALVPLGGRTGLAGGHFETAAGEFGLSLERMNTIEEIDTVNRTMTVQAGCILQVAAKAAEEQDLLLPLDFGARGSATLGVITRAVLRLRPQPESQNTALLGEAIEEGLVSDAVLTRSQSERNELWEIRDDVLCFFELGPFIPFDISVTLDKMEAFVEDIRAAANKMRDPICVFFGHMGDSNLHVSLGNRNLEDFDHHGLEQLVYETVEKYGGSVSAGHGVGLSKREQLGRSRSESELLMMARLKAMLDPGNILNPGKILPEEQVAAQVH